jgi:epoxyqueuosine reductase
VIAPVTEALSLEDLAKAQAYGLGFDLVGIASLGPMQTADAFDAWIERGYAGDMDYLLRGAAKRRDSRLPVKGTASAIVVGMSYGGREPDGPVARYARGDDYHEIMTARLEELHRWLESEVGRPIRGKGYVDTGPILERDLARRAGLGWFGKNTNLINPRIGSFFFIGALLIDLDLKPDAPFDADRCGSCTRCLDACPTDAFAAPRELDATRCTSYLTIEAKGAIPVELREKIGGLIYGCDICQEVCPWNVRFSDEVREDAFRSRAAIDGDVRAIAKRILSMDDDAFRREFNGSPMKRAKRRGLARNAAVALGNVGTPDDIPVLVAALDDPEPLVVEHAAWAIQRLGRNSAMALALAVISAATASAQSTPRYTAADVRFMQGMIGHHAQALAMTALIPERTTRQDIRVLGQRIEVSQKDEIKMMQQWLRDRQQQVPATDTQHQRDADAGHSMSMPGVAMSDTLMPGMLTTVQLAELMSARGIAFDKLFLKDMIQHHEGALVMVASLLGTTGSGQEPEVFRFAAEVDTDQRAEIARMNALLDKLGASGADMSRLASPSAERHPIIH